MRKRNIRSAVDKASDRNRQRKEKPAVLDNKCAAHHKMGKNALAFKNDRMRIVAWHRVQINSQTTAAAMAMAINGDRSSNGNGGGGGARRNQRQPCNTGENYLNQLIQLVQRSDSLAAHHSVELWKYVIITVSHRIDSRRCSRHISSSVRCLGAMKTNDRTTRAEKTAFRSLRREPTGNESIENYPALITLYLLTIEKREQLLYISSMADLICVHFRGSCSALPSNKTAAAVGEASIILVSVRSTARR